MKRLTIWASVAAVLLIGLFVRAEEDCEEGCAYTTWIKVDPAGQAEAECYQINSSGAAVNAVTVKSYFLDGNTTDACFAKQVARYTGSSCYADCELTDGDVSTAGEECWPEYVDSATWVVCWDCFDV